MAILVCDVDGEGPVEVAYLSFGRVFDGVTCSEKRSIILSCSTGDVDNTKHSTELSKAMTSMI
jgi:hypothetical protein